MFSLLNEVEMDSPWHAELCPGPWVPAAGLDGTEEELGTASELLQRVLLLEVLLGHEGPHLLQYSPQTHSLTWPSLQRSRRTLCFDLRLCLLMKGCLLLPHRASCPDATVHTHAFHSPCPPLGCHPLPRKGRPAAMGCHPQMTGGQWSEAKSSVSGSPVWYCPLEEGW